MQVDIEDMATRRLATVRHTGPYYEIGRAFEKLGSIAGRAGLFAHGPTEMIAIYHDDPDATPPNELRSDAALVVPAGIPIPEGMGEDQLPAGRYARTRHRGSYEGLPDAWSRFMGEWLPASGHRVAAGPAYEIYRNTPMDTPKEQLETDLYVPLA